MKTSNKFEKQKKAKNNGKAKTNYSEKDTIREDGNYKYKTNTPLWYKRNAQVAKDVASLSFSHPLGTPLYVRGTEVYQPFAEGVQNVVDDANALPGIMTLYYIPTIGISENGASPVNVAARQVYSWVRHANSGSRNYESPDYMMYLLGLDSAYIYHSELVRVYCAFSTYSYKNRYVNKALIEAMGYDYEDLQQNLASLRSLINQFAVKLNTFASPKEMTLFDRHSQLALNIYADSKLDMSSLYIFRPQQIWLWDGTTSDTGTMLKPLMLHDGRLHTMSDIIDNINTILDHLLTNEDVGMMSGDTLKAFGESGLRQLAMIPDNASTAPIYDEGILAQIHNLTYVGPLLSSEITQDEQGNIQSNIEFHPSVWYPDEWPIVSIQDQLLDSGMENPDEDFVLEATRLMFATSLTVDSEASTPARVRINICGTEVISDIEIWEFSKDDNEFTSTPLFYLTVRPDSEYIRRNATVQSGTMEDQMRLLHSLTTFDWAPISRMTFRYTTGGTSTDPMLYIYVAPRILGNIFNYTILSTMSMENIHQVVLQSLLNVYGTYISNK